MRHPPISWQLWQSSGSPGRWSKQHALVSEKSDRTLCGRLVPNDNANVDDSVGGGDGVCLKCHNIRVNENFDPEVDTDA